jgi:hypothetical protein
MKYNKNKDGENPRKQNVENANSGEVRGFQRNAEMWNNGHQAGAQYGIELTVLELMKGIRKKYPLFAQHIQYRAEDTFKAIPEIVECIVSGFEDTQSAFPLFLPLLSSMWKSFVLDLRWRSKRKSRR